ncbi:uncharacterized protein METZ01_LOCUS304345, partial [marine metagenome]
MSRCLIEFPFGGFRITQNITSIGLFYKKRIKFTWMMSDWWRFLRKHLGRNATNYFMYQWAG